MHSIVCTVKKMELLVLCTLQRCICEEIQYSKWYQCPYYALCICTFCCYMQAFAAIPIHSKCYIMSMILSRGTVPFSRSGYVGHVQIFSFLLTTRPTTWQARRPLSTNCTLAWLFSDAAWVRGFLQPRFIDHSAATHILKARPSKVILCNTVYLGNSKHGCWIC